jgi:acetyl esterase
MTLHPQAVAALEEWSRGPKVTDPGFGPDDVAAMRSEARAVAAEEERESVERVEDLDAGGVPCRLYVPSGADAGASRLLVFLHGGGFVFGDLETHDGQSRRLANRTRSAVLTVGYRRPPEHRFPAAPDDVDTVLDWVRDHGSGLGLDLGRVALVGDSAGGNLALVAALRNPGLAAACVLVYPFVDSAMAGASYAAQEWGLNRGEAAWYWAQYARGASDLADPDLTPLRSERLGTLPVTLVQIAEHDVLADEDAELARRITEAGGAVEVTTYPGMIHGFWRHPELFDAAEEALAEEARFLAAHV